MLAQLEKPTHDFYALARYLVRGRETPPNPNRVAWTLARNLSMDDPELVAAIMTATAEKSKRCTNACYHTIIAWRDDERPTPEVMQAIAIKTLEMAGLAEHQALIMGHGDKAHAHLHMMINRVHPVTGRAWSTAHDYRRFDAIMRQLSEEHGFLYVPGHRFNPDLTDDLPKGPNSKATYAGKRGANTIRPQWSRKAAREYGARISEHLDAAASWDDVEALFAEDGLTLEPKGHGFVTGDAAGYVKLSALGLVKTAKGFAKRRPRPTSGTTRSRSAPSRSRHQPATHRIFTVDAIDIARKIGSKDELRQAVADARAVRKARIARKSLMIQLMAELQERWRASSALRPPKARLRRRSMRTRDKQSHADYRDR